MTDRRQQVEAWGDLVVNFLERTYRIVRGLPHHRLALITVSVGAAILLSPVWEPYLRAIIETFFDIKVDLPTEPIFGFGLVAMGLGYHLLMTWIALRETIASQDSKSEIEGRIRAHDAPVFTAFLQEIPEVEFRNAMSSILNDHSYTSNQSTIFLGAYYFIDTINNQFNDVELQSRADVLKNCIESLQKFVSVHFHPFGPIKNDIIRFCMEPELNFDRGGSPSLENAQKYSRLTDDLTPLVQSTISAYEDFLRNGHTRIM